MSIMSHLHVPSSPLFDAAGKRHRLYLGARIFDSRLDPVKQFHFREVSQFDRPHEFSSCYSPAATLGYLPAGTPRWLERIFPAAV
jgi:hypothetical protein